MVIKHNMSYSPEYAVWAHMINRCTNPNNKRYVNYGGRGIKVCDEWLNSFEAFYDFVGPRPSKKHSIDRIDNNGNYEPWNVKWSTYNEQNRNRSINTLLTYNGETHCIAEWCEKIGLKKQTLLCRLYKWKWTVEESLGTPPLPHNRRFVQLITYNGETLNISEWARKVGLQPSTLIARINTYKWSIEKALTTPLDQHKRKAI